MVTIMSISLLKRNRIVLHAAIDDFMTNFRRQRHVEATSHIFR